MRPDILGAEQQQIAANANIGAARAAYFPRRSLFNAQQGAVQANLQRLQNQVTLFRVLGGGWSTPAK